MKHTTTTMEQSAFDVGERKALMANEDGTPMLGSSGQPVEVRNLVLIFHAPKDNPEDTVVVPFDYERVGMFIKAVVAQVEKGPNGQKLRQELIAELTGGVLIPIQGNGETMQIPKGRQSKR